MSDPTPTPAAPDRASLTERLMLSAEGKACPSVAEEAIEEIARLKQERDEARATGAYFQEGAERAEILKAECAALRARLREMEAALEPFARLADTHTVASKPDDYLLTLTNGDRLCGVPVADFRRAARASVPAPLGAGQGEE